MVSSVFPIICWMSLRPKYPDLAHLAIDELTMPTSSCDFGRHYSDLGDLLEPRRRIMESRSLAAIQCIRSWRDLSDIVPLNEIAR